MIERVSEFIASEELIPANSHLILAVSGGADSMALLDSLRKLQNRHHFTICVATIDHGLRGLDSAQDALFVKDYCETWDIPCHMKKLDVFAYKEKHKLGTQVAARTLRYKALSQFMKETGASHLVTAHHMDDQIETMLLNLTRSTNPERLLGIEVKRPFNGGSLIRPFLCLTKEDIYSYLDNHAVTYRTDPSNFEDHYRRNALRLNVVPQLLEWNPNLAETMSKLRQHLSDDFSFLENEAKKKLKELIGNESISQRIKIPIQEMKQIDPALQRRIFHLILSYLYPALPAGLSSKHEAQFYDLLEKTEASKAYNLPEGLVMEQVYEEVSFHYNQEPMPSVVLNVPGRTDFGEYTFDSTIVSEKAKNERDTLFLPHNENNRLEIRGRVSGDRIYLPEIDGHKKVSRIFIDHKVPKYQRDNWPLILDQDQIVWVVGLVKARKIFEQTSDQYVKIMYHKKH